MSEKLVTTFANLCSGIGASHLKPQVTYIHIVIADSLIDYLTHVAFYVSGWHEQAGTVTQYFLPLTADGDRAPTRGMGLGKVRSGKQEKDIQVKTFGVSLDLSLD